MPETTIRTINGIEQGRANFAYECAENCKNVKNYKSYVKKLPMLIKTNGIGATFAFMFGKKEEAYKKIGDNIFNWLKQDKKKIIDLGNITNFEQLVKKVVEINSTEYKALTNEVMAFLNWLRRFADGLIEDKKDKN